MRVTIIGAGKVGLAYAVFLASKGHEVVAVDKNPNHIESLNNGTFNTTEPGVKDGLHTIKKFSTEDDEESDLCIILVDTPTCYAGYDHSNLEKVLRATKHKNIIVSCTTQPGFMKRWPGVYYNPLFIQLGNQINHQNTTKNVLIGGEPSTILDDFFKQNHGEDVQLHYMSQTAAEVAKLSLNCIITTKISFANMIDEAMWRSGNGSESEKVLAFVGADPRVGDKCLKPGWGYGGPCFPRDNRALCTFLREWGAADYIPVATHETNERHAIVMAMKNDDELDDLNYKPGCPVYCDEESHKKKTKQIRSMNIIKRRPC